MNEKLKEILHTDEKVVWEASPEKVDLFEKPHVRGLVIRWTLCAIFAALAIYYWAYYSVVLSIPASQARTISIITLLICGYVTVLPFFDAKNITKKARYVVTNQRFIAYKPNGQGNTYRDFSDITEATIEYLPTGAANFFIGPVNNSIRKRTHDNIIDYREEYKFDPIVFASIKDVEGLLKVLPSHIKVTGGPKTPNYKKANKKAG